MSTNKVPEINLFNLPSHHGPSPIQLQVLPSDAKVLENSSAKGQEKSLMNDQIFQFQQPSFLKSFEEYLSGHFRLIETHFAQIHTKFAHVDSITSQMKMKIEYLEKQLELSKVQKQIRTDGSKFHQQSPSVQENVNQPNKSLDQKSPQVKIVQKAQLIQVKDLSSDGKAEQITKEGQILAKLEQIEKRIENLQQESKKYNEPFNFQIKQESLPDHKQQYQSAEVGQSQKITQQHQQSPESVAQFKGLSNQQSAKNLYEVLNRKIYHLQNGFSHLQKQVKQQLQKKNKPIEAFAYEVESLKNQLEEFKLKREAKYMRMMSKESTTVEFTTFNQAKKSNSQQENSQNSIQEYLSYLSQKVHFLLASNKELLPRQVYDLEIEHIHQVLVAIRKRLTDKVNYEDLAKVHSIEDIALIKKPTKNTQDQIVVVKKDAIPQKDTGVQSKKDQSKENIAVQQKVAAQPSSKESNAIEQQRPQKVNSSEKPEQKPQKISINSSLLSQMQAKLDSHEEFLKNMNKFYNQKLNLIEITIEKITQNQPQQNQSHSSNLIQQPQLQSPNQEHINQDPASYNLVNHLNHKQEFSPNHKSQLSPISGSESHSHSHLIHALNQEKKPQDSHQMYNFEFTNIRKKISKLNGKYELTEVNIKNFREEIMKYIELVQKNDQNKTDWESFKKAVKYFDQKIKQIQKTIKQIAHVQNEENSHQHGLESSPSQIAAKKKWSCLLCDKQFKNYEGKTTEIRYLGVASGAIKHESPRAVSYMKQSLREKEYEKIYMKSPTKNDLTNKDSGVRKRSLSKSKEYMKHLNEKISLFDHEENQKLSGFNHLN